jgi:TetR/AcrR family transcriptional repressor of nem operon
MQDAVLLFFEENEAWLAQVLEQGRVTGTLEFNGSPLDEGRAIMSCLEGAMLVSRSFGEIDRFQQVVDHLLASLRPAAHMLAVEPGD